jgi:hypothetical protein
MTVAELIAELQKYPPQFSVHLDVSSSDNDGWEGDRVVRNLAGLRIQQGYTAVALDAFHYDNAEVVRQRAQLFRQED